MQNELIEDVYLKVYIIESPADMDLFQGRTEGKALSNILELSQIPYGYFLVTSNSTLQQSIEVIKEDVLNLQDEYMFVWPIIHISCHGNKMGIGLTDNTYVRWSYLHQLLNSINIAFEECEGQSAIFLSMSSCHGLHAIRMDWESDKSPIAFVLGHEEEIPWDDALIAFATFYHNFVNKKLPSDVALKCMNDSINNPNYFKLFNSKDIYNTFKNYNFEEKITGR